MEFEHWLVENYGFDGEGRALKCKPPKFVASDGMFDVIAYEKWKQLKHQEFERLDRQRGQGIGLKHRQ